MIQNLLYDIVIYHRNCSDGSCGYWVARKYLQDNNQLHESIAMHAGEILTHSMSTFEKKRIIYIDVCPNFEFLQELSTFAKDIIILDHHISSYTTIDALKKRDRKSVV